MNSANRVKEHLFPESPSRLPLAYFDRNGGDFPWFLRESDGTESSYASLGEAVSEGLKVSMGVNLLTERQSTPENIFRELPA